jgi:hypothetical protein
VIGLVVPLEIVSMSNFKSLVKQAWLKGIRNGSLDEGACGLFLPSSFQKVWAGGTESNLGMCYNETQKVLGY